MLLSKKMISLLLVLASVSLMCTGFSAWLIVADPENVATDQSTINVSNVIELKTGEVGIYMAGIGNYTNYETNPDNLSFYKEVDNTSSTISYGFISTIMSMQFVISESQFNDSYLDYDDYSRYYLDCSISYTGTEDIFSNDSILITPEYAITSISNFDSQAIKSTISTSKVALDSTNYKCTISTSIPIKSSTENCLFNLMEYDIANAVVPFTTHFKFNENTVLTKTQYDALSSLTYTYTIQLKGKVN